MGMYTRVHCDIVLHIDTPADILGALATMNEGGDQSPPLITPHRFFKCERWAFLFRSESAYFPDQEQRYVNFERVHIFNPDQNETTTYRLYFRSSLKNYDNEIEAFADWVRPFVKSGVIYSQYEEFPDITVLVAVPAPGDLNR